MSAGLFLLCAKKLMDSHSFIIALSGGIFNLAFKSDDFRVFMVAYSVHLRNNQLKTLQSLTSCCVVGSVCPDRMNKLARFSQNVPFA